MVVLHPPQLQAQAREGEAVKRLWCWVTKHRVRYTGKWTRFEYGRIGYDEWTCVRCGEKA